MDQNILWKDKIQKVVEAYYERKFLPTLKMFKRPKLFSIIILCIRYFYQLQLLLSTQVIEQLKVIDDSFQTIQNIQFLKDYYIANEILYIFCAANIIIFFFFIIFFILHLIGVRSNRLLMKATLAFSFVVQIYNYVLFIPSLFFSVNLLSQSIFSYINITLTLIISLVIVIHDQDYCIKINDYLVRNSSFLPKFLILLLEVIQVCIFSLVDSKAGSCLMSIIIGVIRVYLFSSYRSALITHFNLFLSLTILLITAITTICIFTKLLFSFVVCLLIIITLSYHISRIVCSYYYSVNRLKSAENLIENPSTMNTLVRQFLEQIRVEFEYYRVNDYSLVLEEISIEHTMYCKQYPSCFCNIKEEGSNATESKLSLMSGHIRRKFLQDFVFKKLQDCVHEMMTKKNKRNVDLIFNYLNFLIEIQQSKLLFYVELIQIQKQLSLSPLQRCFLNEIYDKASQAFQEIYVTQTRLLQNESEKTISNSYKEESSKDRQIQVTNLLEAITFDEQLNNAEIQFYRVLEIKEDICIHLSKDFVCLQQLKDKCIFYSKQRIYIQRYFQKLFHMNSKSYRLNYLIDCFCLIASFTGTKYSVFMNENSQGDDFNDENEYKSYRKIESKIKNQLQMFSKQVCIVFITLIDHPGAIKRLQNSFQAMFGYSAAEALNKDISLIIPKLIGEHHFSLLMDYFAQPNSSGNNQRRSLSSLIARDKQGWAVPVSIYFKSDSIGVEDCGLTAYIEKIRSDYMYLMLSETDFKCQIMSKELYEKVFSEQYKQGEIDKIFFLRVIPMLKYFEKLKSQSGLLKYANSFDTVAFIPKQKQMQSFNFTKSGQPSSSLFDQIEFEQLQQMLQNMNINDYNIYKVRFRNVSVRNKYFEYHTIEFHQFRLIKSTSTIKECFKFLTYQFSNLLNVHINFEKQFQYLFQLQTNLNISQQNYFGTQYFNNSNIEPLEEYDPHKSKERLSLTQADSQRYFDMPTRQEASNNLDNQQTKMKDFYQFNSQLESIRFSPKPTYATEADLHVKSHFSRIDDQSQVKESTYKKSQQQLSIVKKPDQNWSDPELKQYDDNDGHNQSHHQIELSSPLGLFSTRALNSNGNERYFPSLKRETIPSLKHLQMPSNHKLNEFEEDQSANLAPLTSQRVALKQDYQDLSPVTEVQEQKKSRGSNWFSVIKKKMKERRSFLETNNNVNSMVFDDDDQSVKSTTRKPSKILQFNMFNKKSNKNNEDVEQEINNFVLNMAKLQSANNNNEDSHSGNEKQYNNNNSLEDDNEEEEGNQGKKSETDTNSSGTSQPNRKNKQDQKDDNGEKKFLSKELIKTKVKLMEEEINKKRKKDLMKTAEASSSKNNSSISKAAKKMVKKNIFEKRNNILLITLKAFGAISLLCIVLLTLLTYYQMINNFSIAQDVFKYIPWPLMFRCNYSLSSHYSAILEIIKRNVFVNPHFNSAYQADIEKRVAFSVTDMNNLLLEFETGDQSKLQFFRTVTSQQVEMIINKDLSSISGNKLVNNPNDKYIIKMSMAYFLQQSVGYVYRFSTVSNNLYEQIVRLDNVPSLIANVTGIDQAIYDQSSNILSSLKDSAQILMIVVILIVFVFVISIHPLNAHAQRKCETILKLFATIQQDHLEEMVKPINQTLFLAHKQQKIRLPEVLQQSLQMKKRKNISQTDSLNKFNKKFAFLSFIIFVALIIQPIVNYTQITNFSNLALQNIILVRTLYDLRAQSVSNTSQNYQYLLSRVDPTYLLYNPSYYIKRIPNLLIQNDQKIEGLVLALNSNQGLNQFYQAEFNSFFENIVYGDLCTAMRDHPQYVSTENQIDYDQCTGTRHGMLQKGFLLSLKDFLSEFKELSGIYNMTNATQFKTSIVAWQTRVDLKDFDDYFTILSRSMNSIKDFILIMIQNQLSYNQKVQTILLVYQYIVLAIVFYFGWIRFQTIVEDEMYEVKSLLSVINIDVILENPYIISFLNR